MRNVVISLLAGLVAGVALLTFVGSPTPDTVEVPPPSATLRVTSGSAASEPSVAAVDEAPAERPAPVDAVLPATDDGAPEAAVAQDRIAGLVAVGFTAARASEILGREAELRQSAYLAEYETTGTIRPFNAAAGSKASNGLRSELGDDDYERYLEGTGQPRSVLIRGVDADSAAAYAGLLPGDEILTYAGERVFNQRDLNALMLAGTPGEVVAATIVRDGQTLQLYVTRGPLGLM
jgi:membrane-associated protease RseP (regulator of RpoE activity)